jgi:rhodanese-related sulfurtransferase
VQTGTEVTAIDRATRTVAVGQRAYYATRFLRQRGYRTQNLSGGYATYTALQAAGLAS